MAVNSAVFVKKGVNMKLTEYLKTLNKIYHVTFNPNGPSVTRIH